MRRCLELTLAALLLAGLACGGGQLKMPSTPPPDDNTIAVRVRTALNNAPDVHPAEVQVEVSGGVVMLKGEVHGEKEVSAAVAAARAVSGVREVKSELKSKS
jgi:osmotically-inducible protein OsmY